MVRKALLVGINKYPGCPLQGCINDMQSMSAFLIGYCGWNVSEIRLLNDERATTAAIRDRLEWLVGFATPGDRIFFHYSGHGRQMAKRDYLGKVSRLHDCICPVDFDWSREHALLDTDFADIFADIPVGVDFTWISDSCHSGDLRAISTARRSARTGIDCRDPSPFRLTSHGGMKRPSRHGWRSRVSPARSSICTACSWLAARATRRPPTLSSTVSTAAPSPRLC